MKILGVDWGEKRIGLAVAEHGLAEPLGAVGSVAGILKVAKEQGVEKIVLGLPEGKHRKKVEKLGRKLKDELGIEVIFRSEVLSTRAALKTAIAAGKKRKKRRALDALAAATLLQEYLDSG